MQLSSIQRILSVSEAQTRHGGRVTAESENLSPEFLEINYFQNLFRCRYLV